MREGPPVKPVEPAVPSAGPSQTTPYAAGSASCPVERFNVPGQQLTATARVPLGKPVVLGSMAFSRDGDSGLAKATKKSKNSS